MNKIEQEDAQEMLDHHKKYYDASDRVARRDKQGVIRSNTTTPEFRKNYDNIDWGHPKESK
jgi:hypothetical protein